MEEEHATTESDNKQGEGSARPVEQVDVSCKEQPRNDKSEHERKNDTEEKEKEEKIIEEEITNVFCPRTPPSSPAMHVPLLRLRRSPQPLSSESCSSLESAGAHHRRTVVVDQQIIQPRPPSGIRPTKCRRRISMPNDPALVEMDPGELLEDYRVRKKARHHRYSSGPGNPSDHLSAPMLTEKLARPGQFPVWSGESLVAPLFPAHRFSLPSLQKHPGSPSAVIPPLSPQASANRNRNDVMVGQANDAAAKGGFLATKRSVIKGNISADGTTSPRLTLCKADGQRHANASYPTTTLNDHNNDPSSIPARNASPNPTHLALARQAPLNEGSEPIRETMGFLEALQLMDSRSASPIIRSPPPNAVSQAPLLMNSLTVLPPIHQTNKL